jgi:hypothetical protein
MRSGTRNRARKIAKLVKTILCIAFAVNPDNWTTLWKALSFDAKAIRGLCEKKIKKFGSGAPDWRFF